jgi:hypothetical protein
MLVWTWKGIIIMHLLGKAAEGWLATPKPEPKCGSHATLCSDALSVVLLLTNNLVDRY